MENITVIAALRFSKNQSAKSPVVLRVYVSGKIAKTLSIGIKVLPDHWDASARSVLKGETNYALYNMKIKKEVSSLEAIYTQKSLMGITLTHARAKQIAEGKEPGRDFYRFCQEWIHQKYTNKETLRTYSSELTKLKKFSNELSFGDVDIQFLTNYKKHMRTKLKNSDNTIWKSFKFMNTMIRDAIKLKGIIDYNPFEDFNRGSYSNPVKLGLELMHCNLIDSISNREDVPVLVRRVSINFY